MPRRSLLRRKRRSQKNGATSPDGSVTSSMSSMSSMSSKSSMSSNTKRKSLKRSVSKFLSKSFKKKNKSVTDTSLPLSIIDNTNDDIASKDATAGFVLVDDNPLLDHLLGVTGGDNGVTRNGGSAGSHGDDKPTADAVVAAEKKDGKEECRDESTMTIDILSDLATVSTRQQRQKELVKKKKVPKKLKNAPVSIMLPIKEEEGHIDNEEEMHIDKEEEIKEEDHRRIVDEEVRGLSTRVIVGKKQRQAQQKAAPINVLKGAGLSGSLDYDDDDGDDNDEPTTGVVIVTVEEKKEEWSGEKIPVSRLSLIEEEKDNTDEEDETKSNMEEIKEPILHEKVHGPLNPAVVRNSQSPLQHVTVDATRRILSIIPRSLTMHPMFRLSVIFIMYAIAALLLTRARDSNWSMFRSQPTDTAISRQPSETMSIIPNLEDVEELPVDEPVVISQHLDEIKSFDSFDMDESIILDLDEEIAPTDEPDMSARVIEDLIHEVPTTKPDNYFATNTASVIEDLIHEAPTTKPDNSFATNNDEEEL